jgi:diacylglycerol kinase family enzyme
VWVLLITNPYATSTTRVGRDAVASALASRVDVDVVPTTHRGHAAELGARSVEQGYDAVVVHGGDGSVNEVVNGMLGTPGELAARGSAPVEPADLPAVGVVPGGNANVFARALGVDRHPVQATAQLVDSLVAGRRRTVGLGHMLDRWFLFNAGMGLDASVVRGVDEKRGTGRPVTNLMYLQTAAAAFLKPELTDADITVEVPGRAPVSGVRFGFVSNTAPWTYLGPRAIRTNPGTDFDHGLGLFAATSTALLPSLALGAQLLAGSGDPRGRTLVRDDDLAWVRFTADRPVDVQMDGEYLGMRRTVEFGCRPGVLDVVAGR